MRLFVSAYASIRIGLRVYSHRLARLFALACTSIRIKMNEGTKGEELLRGVIKIVKPLLVSVGISTFALVITESFVQ